MDNETNTLKIVFDDNDSMRHFAMWLCHQGEDAYSELEQAHNQVPSDFFFHRKGKFIPDNTIVVKSNGSIT